LYILEFYHSLDTRRLPVIVLFNAGEHNLILQLRYFFILFRAPRLSCQMQALTYYFPLKL